MKIRVISSADLHHCPITSLDVNHYRDDGSCLCREACPACGATVTRDSHGTYVDETGGDVCTERGDDTPHLGERTP